MFKSFMLALCALVLAFSPGCHHAVKPGGAGIISKNDIVRIYSSSEKSENPAGNAFDGNAGTRWESEWQADPSWIAVELAEKKEINAIKIKWENASAVEYDIEISNDGDKWNKAASVTDGMEGEKRLITLDKPVYGKFVRIFCKSRTISEYGYSVWEINLNPGSAMSAAGSVSKSIRVIDAKASSSENDIEFLAYNAVDGDTGSRWSSEHGVDPQWISLELEKEAKVSAVSITWETASARVYKIQLSKDGKNWTDAAEVTDGTEGEERFIELDQKMKAKFIRIYGEERANDWGYSIFEIKVSE